MRKFLAVISFVMISFGMVKGAYADNRSYVWTYEYMTMGKGTKEFEYYFTFEEPDINASNINTMKHQFEFEYGITDNWDIALYQMLKQKNNDADFEYDGFKIRTRYALAEKNKLPVDILLYFEYIRDGDFHKPHASENKIVLAKDIGRFNFAYNTIVKQVLESGGQTESEYAAGFNYRLNWKVKIGIESKGSYTNKKYYIGPTVAWIADSFWTTLGIVVGANNRSDDLQVRVIIGVPF